MSSGLMCIKVPWMIVASCSLKYKLIYFSAHGLYLSGRHMNSLSANQVFPNYFHFSKVKPLAFTTTKILFIKATLM